MHCFSNVFFIKNSVLFGQTYCPSSGVSTLYTAIGTCHTGYADCLLARSGWNWPC